MSQNRYKHIHHNRSENSGNGPEKRAESILERGVQLDYLCITTWHFIPGQWPSVTGWIRVSHRVFQMETKRRSSVTEIQCILLSCRWGASLSATRSRLTKPAESWVTAPRPTVWWTVWSNTWRTDSVALNGSLQTCSSDTSPCCSSWVSAWCSWQYSVRFRHIFTGKLGERLPTRLFNVIYLFVISHCKGFMNSSHSNMHNISFHHGTSVEFLVALRDKT